MITPFVSISTKHRIGEFDRQLNIAKELDRAGVMSGTEQLFISKLVSKINDPDSSTAPSSWAKAEDLMDFFADRLKVYLKDQGARHDLIDAVFALGGQDDLLMIVRRVEALSKFLETDDGKNLLAGVKRATNIVKAEEKKDGKAISGKVDQSILVKGEEKDLHRAVEAASALAHKALAEEDFEATMRAIAKLRGPVDAFLDNVTVNDPNRDYRENRLRLLNRIREAVAEVADFSKIEG